MEHTMTLEQYKRTQDNPVKYRIKTKWEKGNPYSGKGGD